MMGKHLLFRGSVEIYFLLKALGRCLVFMIVISGAVASKKRNGKRLTDGRPVRGEVSWETLAWANGLCESRGEGRGWFIIEEAKTEM